ncbi:hypothetical protein AAFF_G00394160 [Aldrovandia affinis]|uniref:C2H2-type domain-containing protein n=1 Tax=Aldrovandia affinis TaxID=143900 RepID=A0AAD7WKW1_9TELE|nr:hypothetical protein AAFF_G00394160 [Aldrovandia affinis]
MEIQGLTVAQNTHHKHGVSHRTGLSPPGTATGARSLALSNKIGVKNESETRERESDNNNNNWARTSPYRLLAENGSGGCQPFLRQNSKSNAQQVQKDAEQTGLRNVTSSQGKGVKDPQQSDCLETGLKCEFESGETGMQMALPVCVVEEGHTQQRQQPPLLRQPHQGGATLHNSLVCEAVAAGKGNVFTAANINRKDNEEFYVVFNIVQEADSNGPNKEMGRSIFISKDGRRMISKDTDSSRTKPDISTEVQTTSVLIHPDEKVLNLTSKNSRKYVGARNLINPGSIAQERCEATVTNSSQRLGLSFESDSSVAMANEFIKSERCDNQPLVGSISVNDVSATDQTPVELPHQSAQKFAGALISENATFTDAAQMSDVNSPDYLSDFTTATAAGGSNVSNSDETFSGTIMINNQSIIVTIENGVLTLAAPPDGHAPKEDGLVNLKHHLGVKDHQDIVLINYDGATKAVGKSGSAAVGSIQYEESRMAVGDSGLSLEENCPFPDAASALDSSASAKEQDDGTLCSLGDGDMVGPGGRAAMQSGFIVCDSDLPPLKLGGALGKMSKKGSRTTYRCPQPECSEAFDTKHKLKVHLISHADDQRPFKCTVEDCGWSFTTSYKLKRHLQSHDKVRPFTCEWENCGRKFTTVYNLKAHVKAHDQENSFACDICSERFRSATKLGNHQRAHFEPERPHKCEFPGCEKTFITFSALFSHNRTHFREIGQFTCTFPGCDKRYDKACRLKIHLRSHTGERPFMCDSEGCGWSFTSMSKLLRHKRKHDDDRRFTCPEEGCGKSFTRAEHLKGHSITHLGTKPFECHIEGCSAKFSARSSLYIHSKKHLQDASGLRTRCPVASCSKHFSSRSSLKSHMLKHHNLSPDVLSQLEMSTSLTPSSELTSAGQAGGAAGGAAGELGNIDLSSLFSNVPGGGAAVAVGPGASGLTMDMSLVNSGILTIDAASVGATLGGAAGALAQAVDPLILAAGADISPHGLDGALGAGSAGRGLPQGTLNLDDVQTVNPEALGSLAALAMRGPVAPEQLHALSSSSALGTDAPASLTPSSSLAGAPVPELLSAAPKPDRGGGGPLLGATDVLGQQEGSKVVTQFVFSGHAGSFSAQKDPELNAVSTCSFLESGGSARTDYRAIQLAKRKKQKGPGCSSGGTGLGPRKSKGVKASSAAGPAAPASGRFSEGVASANGGLTIRDPVTGAQYVQIQLLQDDPAGDGDLAFQLSSQTSSSHSQLTVDLPVNILQEPAATTEDDAGSDNSQFTGSTINLQDLE